MNKWQEFWNGLNIRKAITLLFGLGFIIVSLIVVIEGVRANPIDKELIEKGLVQLGTIASVCISYYMGYSNSSSSNINSNSTVSNSNKISNDNINTVENEDLK